MISKSWSSCLSLGGSASRCSRPCIRPRSSEISEVFFHMRTAKRTIKTTRPIDKANASEWCQKERMESQAAKTQAIPSRNRTRKVSHQSCRWRFSNCSKREVTAERASPPDDELREGRVGRWFPSAFIVGAIRANQGPWSQVELQP